MLGDVICAMNGLPVKNTSDLQKYLYDVSVGETVTFTVYRKQTEMNVDVVLGVAK